jgi:hypothetical protein
MEDICEKVREQIPELVTGALKPETAAELRHHIDQCPACREYLQALQTDGKLLGEFAEAMQPVVTRLEDEVIEALGREPSKQPVRFVLILRAITRSSRTKVAAAAAIIIVVLIGVKIFTGRVEPERLKIAKHEDVFVSEDAADAEWEGMPETPVAVGMRERTKPLSDVELEAELESVREMIAAGDIDSLAAVLEKGSLQSRIVAANYLAKIGDSRGIVALEELSAITVVSSEPNGALAIGSVAERLADANVSRLEVVGAFKTRKSIAARVLDGKNAVVRVYRDWRTEPAKFETVSVQVAGGAVNFDSIKFGPNEVGQTVIAVFGEDQTDVNVAEAVGDCIYAEPYKKGLRFSLPFGRFDGKEELRVVFHDAFDANAAAVTDGDFSRGRPIIGKPIPEAEVEMFLRAYEGPRIQVGRYLLDEQGSLPVPRVIGSLNWFDFVISHPDYGIAKESRPFSYHDEMAIVSLPLVRRDSVAGQRAIWGTIVDPEGNPVAGATIECRNVRTLGEGLINSSISERCKAVSDANGFFTFYMPNVRRRDQRGLLIPPKSRYQVKIEAPKELELVPYVGEITNGQETAIVMEWGDYLRTFVFEDGSGPITDLERLKAIHIIIERKGEELLRFRYNDWKDGGRFPLGTYQALLYRAGEPGKFEPLEVTEDSPEQLIFRLSESIFYHGRVIHGLTDEPMERVFVIAMYNSEWSNFSQITAEQWELLHELPADPCISNEALEPVKEIYGFSRVARTDANGWFGISVGPLDGLYAFVFFEENYLAIMHQEYALKSDAAKRAEVPEVKLYPAAKLTIEPRVEGERISIWPRWVIDKEDNPAWVGEFLATNDIRGRSFIYDQWLKQNEIQTLHVPAGLNVRIKLDTPYDHQWCPIDVDETINLQQGETYDLARHTFEKGLKVSVKVVSSAGEPVEGVPVGKRVGGGGWDVPHNSDEKGIARFNVCPYTGGEFGVFYEAEDEDDVDLRESIPYEIAGPNDANSVYTFQISDEMLYHLFK